MHGILVNGSMGGFAFLTDSEQERSLAIVLDEVSGADSGPGRSGRDRAPAGPSAGRGRSRPAGVHSLSVLAPFYFLAVQEHLVNYFIEIAESVECPVFLYDNPTLTKNPIHPETVAELRRRVPTDHRHQGEQPGLRQSPEAAADCSGRIPRFSILIGSESLLVVGLQMGCDGFVGGLHNVCPALAVAFYDAFVAGDLERARDLQQQLVESRRFFVSATSGAASTRRCGISRFASARPARRT